MGIVNRTTAGLLSLLDSQTQGDTPSNLGDVIAPTVDTTAFLLASARYEQLSLSTAAVLIPGEYNQFTVPAGQVWAILSVGCQWFNGDVGQTSRYGLFLRLGLIDQPCPITEIGAAQVLTAIASSGSVTFVPKGPFLLPSGAQISTQLMNNTNAGINGSTVVSMVNFCRLQA